MPQRTYRKITTRRASGYQSLCTLTFLAELIISGLAVGFGDESIREIAILALVLSALSLVATLFSTITLFMGKLSEKSRLNKIRKGAFCGALYTRLMIGIIITFLAVKNSFVNSESGSKVINDAFSVTEIYVTAGMYTIVLMMIYIPTKIIYPVGRGVTHAESKEIGDGNNV